MSNLILAVDPGITGAMCVLDPTNQTVVELWDMPKSHKAGMSKTIDVYQLGIMLDSIARKIAVAVIEKVHSLPHDGHVGAFSFGYHAGIIKGALGLAMVPMVFIDPVVWKLGMGLSRDKNLSREKASKLFPSHRAYFMRKKDDGRAEACLLALWAVRTLRDVKPISVPS